MARTQTIADELAHQIQQVQTVGEEERRRMVDQQHHAWETMRGAMQEQSQQIAGELGRLQQSLTEMQQNLSAQPMDQPNTGEQISDLSSSLRDLQVSLQQLHMSQEQQREHIALWQHRQEQENLLDRFQLLKEWVLRVIV